MAFTVSIQPLNERQRTRAGALRQFAAMAPSPLEAAEKLEQLRFLESGHRIVMAEAAEFIPPGVDTPADLERARRMIEAGC